MSENQAVTQISSLPYWFRVVHAQVQVEYSLLYR